MNENIDLTLRKIFLTNLDNGQRARFDDEEAYNIKFGESRMNRNAPLSEKGPDDFEFMSLYFENRQQEVILGVEEKERFQYETDEAASRILGIYSIYDHPMGDGTHCDCCGIMLNPINNTRFFVCIDCNKDLEETSPNRASNVLGNVQTIATEDWGDEE